MRSRRWSLVLIAMLAMAVFPSSVIADGDPASDVLLGQSVFYPYNPPISASVQKTLNAETTAAARNHFPIKVALIGSPVDLGVIPDLFGQPQKYADFLDQEISFQARQPLLVVMASGYGVQGMGSGAKATVASLAKPSAGHPDDLGRAAINVVAKLARANGHPIQDVPGVPGASGGSGGSSTLIVILLAVAAVITAGALVAVRRRQATPS